MIAEGCEVMRCNTLNSEGGMHSCPFELWSAVRCKQ